MAKSDDEKPQVEETEAEQAGHTVKESSLVEVSERTKDPAPKTKASSSRSTYPPKPTDGKS